MQFDGRALVDRLNRQTATVTVWDHQGGAAERAPELAARIAARGGYVGFGSGGRNGRIRYIRPNCARLWRGSRTTERITDEDGNIVAADFEVKHVGAPVLAHGVTPAWMRDAVPVGAVPVRMGNMRPGAKPVSADAAFRHCFDGRDLSGAI